MAYAFYAVAVVVGLAAIGFSLATAALVALGFTWSWVIVLAAVVVAVVIAIAAIAGNVPMVLLAVLSALAGAHAIVAGAMLLIGDIALADVTSDAVPELVQDRWWWYAAYGVLAVVGIIAQLSAGRGRHDTLRDAWAAPGDPPRPA